jgi:hypothetical protein
MRRTRTIANTTARGYGTPHQRERQRWAPYVNAGQVRCARCGQPIIPGTAWDLGHSNDRSTWTGPEHARCNRAAGARYGNRKRGTVRQITVSNTSRRW